MKFSLTPDKELNILKYGMHLLCCHVQEIYKISALLVGTFKYSLC